MGPLILKGFVTGLVLSIMLGPAFFMLLETSIRKGIRAALCFDAGVILSDIIYIIIAFVFYSEVKQLSEGENEVYIKLIGGVLFLVFGLVTYFKKTKDQKTDKSGKIVQNSKDYIMLFVKGLVLNLANPLVVFYWFGVIALSSKGSSGVSVTGGELLLYLGVILFTFIAIDVLKVFGAKKLRPFITNAVLRSLNRVTGIILMAFGVFLVVQSSLIMYQNWN